MGEGQGSPIEQLNHVYILGKQREYNAFKSFNLPVKEGIRKNANDPICCHSHKRESCGPAICGQ